MTVETPGRKRLEYALLLIARQHGASPETAQAATRALARWRASEPANELAARAALAGWAQTDGSALQCEVPLPATHSARLQQNRRRALSVLGLAGVSGLAGLLGRWHWMQPLEQMSLHTGHGQHLSRQLSDGSQLDLAPGTNASVEFHRQRRRIHLRQGEIRLDVARDAERPLEVYSALGRVRVLGTVFSVALRPAGLQVSVARGRVAVWQQARMADQHPDAVLGPGQGLRIDAGGALARYSLDVSEVGAWREGWLVFDHTPLSEVVARWNDYLARPLVLNGGPSLHSLRLTGSFKLHEPAVFIASLPRSLPVRVQSLPDGRVSIRRR
ncbi:FecR family protein [Comamonas sp.]|uniref:FecR family protein n=1 Tax=Comamonas sp. TaxID=34028 RepID=UPI0012C8F9CD|nr:FecR domain-containing protein [Comamonas sp.]MPS92359.1 iron dicitrate transport regulator FecR [Comamonas sp.]